ncbi:hypothetical protein JRQ81_006796, partial [Phrynocephalus forsythii]
PTPRERLEDTSLTSEAFKAVSISAHRRCVVSSFSPLKVRRVGVCPPMRRRVLSGFEQEVPPRAFRVWVKLCQEPTNHTITDIRPKHCHEGRSSAFSLLDM